jgi:hypothetical protein
MHVSMVPDAPNQRLPVFIPPAGPVRWGQPPVASMSSTSTMAHPFLSQFPCLSRMPQTDHSPRRSLLRPNRLSFSSDEAAIGQITAPIYLSIPSPYRYSDGLTGLRFVPLSPIVVRHVPLAMPRSSFRCYGTCHCIICSPLPLCPLDSLLPPQGTPIHVPHHPHTIPFPIALSAAPDRLPRVLVRPACHGPRPCDDFPFPLSPIRTCDTCHGFHKTPTLSPTQRETDLFPVRECPP